MINYQEVSLFEDLNPRYPMAAAGLIHDLCDRVSVWLENESPDEHALDDACETLAQILRPFREQQLHASYPWDAAYDRFGRWLMRGLPRYRDAIIAITGWSDEQMATCKAHFIETARIFRDDWNRAGQDLEGQVELVDNQGERVGIVHRPPTEDEIRYAKSRIGSTGRKFTVDEVIAKVKAL